MAVHGCRCVRGGDVNGVHVVWGGEPLMGFCSRGGFITATAPLIKLWATDQFGFTFLCLVAKANPAVETLVVLCWI